MNGETLLSPSGGPPGGLLEAAPRPGGLSGLAYRHATQGVLARS